MAYKDLPDFLEHLKKHDEIVEIDVEVDPELEITEITDRVSKAYGKALKFNNVKGSKYPLVINTFGSYERLNMALEIKELDEISDTILDFMDISNYVTLFSKIKSVPKLARLATVFPRTVTNAPCQEVIEEPDLDTIPVIKCWPQDGGKFLTLPLIFTKDPEDGQQNCGMYRMQVYDKKTTGMHWHLHKDGAEIYEKYKKLGKRMPVSVALGCDPAVIYASTAPMPKMIDEMIFAGFLRKSPVKMVKSVTNDIMVPANAEFILEGYVDLDELRLEGPFGDHTGYYSMADMYPVFHIEKITRKKNPIYPTLIVGQPPQEDCYLGKATEKIFLPLMKLMIPELVGLHMPFEGVFHNCVIVSIKKAYPKHAFKVANGMWGLGQMMYAKMIIIVDEDVDPSDVSKVMWKVFNNTDPVRDYLITEGPLDALDHSSNTQFFGNRVAIDATKKWKSEGYDRIWPDDIVMEDEVKKMVDQRWSEYGIK